MMYEEGIGEMSKFFRGLFTKRPMANANADLPQLGKCYAMAVNDNGEAEITLYGDIVEEIPRDWWTDEPIEGMYISLEAFLQDLKTLENAKSITVRIHSAGGDAAASITIHNRLRELAKKASITVIVDGIAMSGGSLIMCAGDTVKVNPSSLIMIHRCWCFLIGGYNSTELRQIADSNDAYDKAQAAIYRKKTGKPDEELLALMEATYYMTGEEAVENGFADEVLDGDRLSIAASADRRTLYVDGRTIRLPAAARALPSKFNIPTVTAAQADAINKNKPAMPGSEGGKNLMAKNLEELRKENPELAATVEAEVKAAAAAAAPTGTTADQGAIKATLNEERKRMQEIDEIASMVNDDDLVKEAKYGDKACTAQELAFRAMQKQAKQGKEHMDETTEDYKASNAGQVAAAPNGDEENTSAEVDATVDAGVEAAKKAYGGK